MQTRTADGGLTDVLAGNASRTERVANNQAARRTSGPRRKARCVIENRGHGSCHIITPCQPRDAARQAVSSFQRRRLSPSKCDWTPRHLQSASTACKPGSYAVLKSPYALSPISLAQAGRCGAVRRLAIAVACVTGGDDAAAWPLCRQRHAPRARDVSTQFHFSHIAMRRPTYAGETPLPRLPSLICASPVGRRSH